MVKIRLRRTGKKGEASYQVVLIDSRQARDAEYLEKVGFYLPLKSTWKLNSERILFWLDRGAQPTKTVKNLLQKEKIWAKFFANKSKKTTKTKIIKNPKKT